MHELPIIWQLEAELARIAEEEQSAMRLPLISTDPARSTLMALPFSPLPPLLAVMRSMRFEMTMVASSPASERHTRIPLAPQSCT